MHESHIFAHSQLVPVAKGRPLCTTLRGFTSFGTTRCWWHNMSLFICEVIKVIQVLVYFHSLLNLIILSLFLFI